ncbi:MAG: hypothetical protein JRG91_10745 [Deltaproteobacteria bacterium]|nr:hypothetical protein [Deltaproteobacteria bacterium]
MVNTRNFHVPLPDSTYMKLKDEARRQGRPATEIAREAIAGWLEARRRETTRDAIAAYAAEHAGTSSDLDEALEAEAAAELFEGGKR